MALAEEHVRVRVRNVHAYTQLHPCQLVSQRRRWRQGDGGDGSFLSRRSALRGVYIQGIERGKRENTS